MTRIGGGFASHLHSTQESEATESDVWIWIAVTVACIPWLVALVAWLSWR
jgi:hypothetical protein